MIASMRVTVAQPLWTWACDRSGRDRTASGGNFYATQHCLLDANVFIQAKGLHASIGR